MNILEFELIRDSVQDRHPPEIVRFRAPSRSSTGIPGPSEGLGVDLSPMRDRRLGVAVGGDVGTCSRGSSRGGSLGCSRGCSLGCSRGCSLGCSRGGGSRSLGCSRSLTCSRAWSRGASRGWEGGGPGFSRPARGPEGVVGGKGFVMAAGPSGIFFSGGYFQTC